MKALGTKAGGGLAVNWRSIEWWGAGMALFLQTGAVFPLLAAHADGSLDDAAKARLRLLSIPVYVFAGLILSRHFQQFLVALRRNLQLVLLLALPFASVLWSVSPSMTLRRAVGLLFTLLLAYMLAIRFTPRQLLLLAMATFGSCIMLSLALLAVSPGLARMPTDGMARGIFIHKNSLGWYASIVIVTAAVVVMDGSPELRRLRRIAFVLLAAGVTCLVGSGSMTAVIATAAAGGLFWFYSTLPRSRGIGRAVFVILFVEAAVLLLISLQEFLVPVLEALGKDATLTGRVPLWRLVDKEIVRHLLLGFGYQAFWTEANPQAWAIWSKIGWQAPHAHNGFRDILLNFGIGGTGLFVLIFLRALYQGARLQCRATSDGWLWLNVFVVMVLVMNLTESIFLMQNDAIFTLFTAAVVMFSLYTPAYETTALEGMPKRRAVAAG
ncbi:MAG: O-antigen ligase family protein [Rhizobiaceae bacterium]|nr:MAG: O-antigen ligase family protein [Rhizobiaceae bacterium]